MSDGWLNPAMVAASLAMLVAAAWDSPRRPCLMMGHQGHKDRPGRQGSWTLNGLEGTPCEVRGATGRTQLNFSTAGVAEIVCDTTPLHTQLEPNDTADTATVLPLGEDPIAAAIATIDDVDYWRVVPPGSCTTKNPCALKITLSHAKNASGLWPAMCVWRGEREENDANVGCTTYSKWAVRGVLWADRTGCRDHWHRYESTHGGNPSGAVQVPDQCCTDRLTTDVRTK